MSIISETAAPAAGRSFWLGVAAYLLPTFALGYTWHLVLFAPGYQALQIYRPDLLIPFGFAAIAIQAVIFSWAYPRAFPRGGGSVLRNGLLYGLAIGLLSWSFTTLAVAAKFPMTSLSGYIALETGFTAVQFLIVGPLIALAYRN
jgi:hypothetical protein